MTSYVLHSACDVLWIRFSRTLQEEPAADAVLAELVEGLEVEDVHGVAALPERLAASRSIRAQIDS